MKKMQKTLLTLSLTLALSLSIVGCKQNNPLPQQQEVEKIETLSTMQANSYIVDTYTTKEEDKQYHMLLQINSEDYKTKLKEENVVYQTTQGYIPLTKEFEGSKVTIYDVRKGEELSSYIHIQSNQILDWQKVFVYLEGAKKATPNMTKEQFLKDGGKEEDWKSTYVKPLSTKTTPLPLDPKAKEGVLMLKEVKPSFFAYKYDEKMIEGDKLYYKIDITSLGEGSTMEEIEKAFERATPTKELEKNISFFTKANENTIYIGYKTNNGESIASYAPFLPSLSISFSEFQSLEIK